MHPRFKIRRPGPGRAFSLAALPVAALPILALLMLNGCVPAAAADVPAAARHAIEQPAQPLADALRAIARQTGVSVLFDPGTVQGRLSRPVSGRLSVGEALSRALEGSGLSADFMPDGAVVVRPAPGALPPQRQGQLAPADAAPLRLAAADGAGGVGKLGAVAAADEPAQQVPVTGTRFKRVESEGPTPVNVYTREDIERSGQPSLDRFLASLNEVSASAGEGGFASTLGQATVQLRGMPLGSTLVLVNGRRVQAVGSSSANFFNLGLIPLAAVERVEIVPVGSSAVYGGDALAGVVNIILKKHIDGQALALRLGSARGTGDSGVSLATGGADAHSSYLLLGSYSRTTALGMAERGFFVDADYRRFGGPDARARNCTPGTVSSVSGANLPGLDSSLAGIPQLAVGQAPQLADFRASAGQANLCNLYANGRGFALVHGNETLGLHAMGQRRIAGSWSAFGELTLAREHLQGRDIGLSLNDVLVPASNPYNPFGEAVRVTALLGPANGSQGLLRSTDFSRLLVGLQGELGGGWDAELTASTTRDRSQSRMLASNVDTAARAAALASADPATALNPFTTGRAASDAVLQGIWSDSVLHGHGRKDQLGGFVRGQLLNLPAGPLEAIAGAEGTRDVYEAVIPGDTSVLDARRATAVYGELRAPLLRADTLGSRGWNLAALTLAARRDRYSDFGSAATYQAGLELRPSRGLLLRASTATSFKPPTLLQTSVEDFRYPADWFGLVDPARGGEAIVAGDVVRSTNRGLGPERGRAQALGAVWEPEGSLGTRLGITAWRMRIDGLISILDPQAALDNEAQFPGFVTRAPAVDGQPGPVTRIALAEVNYGSLATAGTDLEAGYAWRTAAGRWTLGAGATRTTEYRVVLAPGTAAQDRLGRRYKDHWAPRWKGRLSAALDAGAWSLGLTSRYLGSYLDAGSSSRQLGGFWVHDLAGALDLKRLGWMPIGGAKAAHLALSVVNASNRQPQFVGTTPFFDVTQADWRGRYASLQLSVDW